MSGLALGSVIFVLLIRDILWFTHFTLRVYSVYIYAVYSGYCVVRSVYTVYAVHAVHSAFAVLRDSLSLHFIRFTLELLGIRGLLSLL